MRMLFWTIAMVASVTLEMTAFPTLNQVQAGGPAGGWTSVPIVTQDVVNSGNSGGEGGQWPHTIEASDADGNLIFYGTNTGGIYRSVNGGENWDQINNGFSARGCNAVAIDPVSPRHVLAAGISDRVDTAHGLYLSMNSGESWTQTLNLPICGNKYIKKGLAFDPSSYRPELGYCATAYYSTPYEEDDKTELSGGQRGLYRSPDGGVSWQLINSAMSDAWIRVTDNGVIYGARRDGLYRSEDSGQSFEKCFDKKVTGFDCTADGKRFYISSDEGLYAGTDGRSFEKVSAKNYPSDAKNIEVNPKNPDKLLLSAEDDQGDGLGKDAVFASEDGGKNWERWHYDAKNHFLPYNSREQVFAWSGENTAFTFAASSVAGTDDSGKNWRWKSNGICGILCGGKFNFNIHDPNLIYFGAQDSNGAVSRDGGRTWTFVNLSGKKEYGHVYGGYAADRNTLWGCSSKSWNARKEIRISYDGGKSYKKTGIKISPDIPINDISSYQSYNDPDVFFAANFRSGDRGKTWKGMEDCLQVYAHNPAGQHELYGCKADKGYVVVSYDEGKTWNTLNQEEIPLTKRTCLQDIAVSPTAQKLYVAANAEELYEVDMVTGAVVNLTDRLPLDEFGRRRVNSVSVDPANPNLLYVAGTASTYNRQHTVLFSADGGATFGDLSIPQADGANKGGVNSALCIRINPATGEVWCSTACYGLRKFVR